MNIIIRRLLRRKPCAWCNDKTVDGESHGICDRHSKEMTAQADAWRTVRFWTCPRCKSAVSVNVSRCNICRCHRTAANVNYAKAAVWLFFAAVAAIATAALLTF